MKADHKWYAFAVFFLLIMKCVLRAMRVQRFNLSEIQKQDKAWLNISYIYGTIKPFGSAMIPGAIRDFNLIFFQDLADFDWTILATLSAISFICVVDLCIIADTSVGPAMCWVCVRTVCVPPTHWETSSTRIFINRVKLGDLSRCAQ